MLTTAHNIPAQKESLRLEKRISDIHNEILAELVATKYKTDINILIKKLDIANELAQQTGNMQMLVMGLWRKGALLRNLQRFDEAVENYREGIGVALANNVMDEAGGIYDSLGNLYIDCSELEKAEEYYVKSREIYKAVSNIAKYAKATGSLAYIYIMQGDSMRGLEICLEALQLCEEDKIEIPENILEHISMAYEQLGENDKAIDFLYRAEKAAAYTNNPMVRSNLLNNLAQFAGERGDYEEAAALLHRALELYDGVQMDAHKLYNLSNLATAYAKLHKPEQARIYIAQADEILAKADLPMSRCGLDTAKATLAQEENDYAAAAEYYREAKEIAQGYGDSRFVLTSLLGLADVVGVEEREGILLEALEVARNKGLKKLLSDIYQSLAECYEQRRDFEQSLRYFREHSAIQTVIMNENSERRIQILQLEYRVEQLKNELEQQRRLNDDNLKEAERKRQELIQLSFQLSLAGKAIETIRRYARRGMQSSSGQQLSCFRQIVQASGTQLSPLQWDIFEDRFQNMHSEFMGRMRKGYPALSPAELKVCALIKTGCSLKEAASLLCVSTRTLENHRISIRKKLGLSKSQNLTNFIASV